MIENQLGKKIDFSLLGPRRAQGMLSRVQGLLHEHRSKPSFHQSQNNPAYLNLIMMEQALKARVSEQMPGQDLDPAVKAAMMKDPKLNATIKKASMGTPLSREEQGKLAGVALMSKTESARPRRMVKESELQQAQVVLAAQDMVDRIQKMTEDLSEMQFKDLPALVASIKNDMGLEQATQFQTQAGQALSNLLQSVQQGKTELESAQGVLSGEAPIVPGQDPMGDAGLAGDENLDIDLDDTMTDVGDQDDDEEEISATLGRDRR